MSDIKKIKDDYLNKLDSDLNIESVNQIKTELFGKNGKISNSFKKLAVTKLSLTNALLTPSLDSTLLKIKSFPEFRPWFMIFLYAKCSLLIWNSAITTPSLAPFLIREKSALIPIAKPKEDNIIDFPAPVSPEKTENPLS